MALNFTQMKDNMAQAIADAIAAASGQSIGTLELQGIGVTATWPGGSTGSPGAVAVPDTTALAVGNLIRENTDKRWFQITGINPNVSVQVTDLYLHGGNYPTGGAPVDLTQTLTWDGSNLILTNDTSGISVGDNIRLNSDGGWFSVGEVITNTSIFVGNPLALTIPSGSTTSSVAQTSFTSRKLPNPPSGSDLLEKFGEPIAFPVVDEGIQVLSTSPHEMPNFTVSGANGIGSPVIGSMVYVTDQNGGGSPAYYDGASWRTVYDRTVITT